MKLNYTLAARTYPVLIALLPIAVLSSVYTVEVKSQAHLYLSGGLIVALYFVFSQLGRDRGKRKELELWNMWGGMPTVQLFRLSDNRIDNFTKQRYHQKLMLLSPVPLMPSSVSEQTNASDCDSVYRHWTTFLISRCRDTKEFPLLFQENVNYGFRRNLWGLKPYAISLIILSSVGDHVYRLSTVHFKYVSINANYLIVQGLLLLLLLFWVVIVSKNWVKVPAFAYAQRLLEATEKI